MEPEFSQPIVAQVPPTRHLLVPVWLIAGLSILNFFAVIALWQRPESEATATADLVQILRESMPALPNVDVLAEDIANRVVDAEGKGGAGILDSEAIVFRTVADLEAEFAKIGAQPELDAFAKVFQAVDEWAFSPEDEPRVVSVKFQQAERMREIVKIEVEKLQKSALEKAAARDGFADYASAQRLLDYFPISNDLKVARLLRSLQDGQASLANKLDALQRLRYNSWAVRQVSSALRYRDEHLGRIAWDPLNGNVHLVEPVASILGPIDQKFLEPAALDFYTSTYVIIRDTLGKDVRRKFAEQLTKPDIKRKTLDLF